MANITTKELLLARLPRSEGRTVKPYLDTQGKWTVGVGHNISVLGLPPKMVVAIIENGKLTDAMVDELLIIDVDGVLKACQEIAVFNKLDVARQSVVGDMVFNIGLAGVLGFENTLSAVGRSDWEDAARNMLKSKWAEQVGNRAIQLAEIMRSGQVKSPKALV